MEESTASGYCAATAATKNCENDHTTMHNDGPSKLVYDQTNHLLAAASCNHTLDHFCADAQIPLDSNVAAKDMALASSCSGRYGTSIIRGE